MKLFSSVAFLSLALLLSHPAGAQNLDDSQILPATQQLSPALARLTNSDQELALEAVSVLAQEETQSTRRTLWQILDLFFQSVGPSGCDSPTC